jgi:hypothetical protein
MKKFFLAVVLSICILVSVSVSKVNAVETFYNCNIVQIGSGWGYVMIMLTDQGGAFSNKWFYIFGSSDVGKQMLATALTTITLGKAALIYADPFVTPAGYFGPTISGFYVTQ